MDKVKTFVFFDLETTGLDQSKITEISFVAANREQILEKHNGVAKENNFGDCLLPRVLNKINFTVYPCKVIHPTASAMSGLTNENLEHQKPFDDNIFNILKLFMERLEKPVCLVAHNGNKFDFPILKSELIKIGKDFPEDVFCVDSLPAFRDVLSDQPKVDCCGENNQNNVSNDIRPLDAPSPHRAADLVPKCGFSQEDYDQELVRALEVSERIVREYDNNFDMAEIQRRVTLEMRKANETTPTRRSKQVTHAMGDHARRQILNEPKKPKQKFTLSAVYERVVKKELLYAHRAEGDALALLECITAVGSPIMDWMDKNKIPFRSIKRVW